MLSPHGEEGQKSPLSSAEEMHTHSFNANAESPGFADQATDPHNAKKRARIEQAQLGTEQNREQMQSDEIERPMDVQLAPVSAVVLVRDSLNASQARLLLPHDIFPRRGEDPTPAGSASDLAEIARTRAEKKLGGEVDEVILVFDTLPILAGTETPATLEPGDVIDLRKPLKALKLNTSLRADGETPTCEEFYVLVTRLEQSTMQDETKHPESGDGIQAMPSGFSRAGAATPPPRPVKTQFGQQPPLAGVSIVDSFVTWLDELYPPVAAPRDVGKYVEVLSFAQKLQFEGRSSLVDDCLGLLNKRFAVREVTDRKSHPIGVLGGASGIGKTRALKELIKELEKFAAEKGLPWVAPVLITYNGGQTPEPDRALNDPQLASALRILYFAFRHDLGETTFDDWVSRVLRLEYGRMLTPSRAVRIIRSVMDSRNAERKSNKNAPGLVYIAVDETNYLLGEHKSGDYEQHLAFLRETMKRLAPILLRQEHVFVFAATAGIAVAPLELALLQSTAPYTFFRMELLDWEALMRIMDGLEQNEEQGGSRWQGWHSDTQFVKLLVDYAPIPGIAAVLLQECFRQIQDGRDWCKMDYHRLETKAQEMVKAPHDVLAAQLIEDVVLSAPVSRIDRVVPGLDWTYQHLETSGLIVLSSSAQTRVHLIRPVFDQLLECALKSNRQDSGLYMLQQALTIIPSDSSMSLWQQFESFCAHFEAAKEMLWHARKGRTNQATLSIQDFYGAGAIHKAGTQLDTQLVLSETVVVEQRLNLCSDTVSIRSDEGLEELEGHEVITASEASFNTFRCRRKLSGEQMLVAVQHTLDVKTALSLADVKMEAAKIQGAVTRIQQLLSIPDDKTQSPAIVPAIDHRLVIYATRVAPELLQPRLPHDFPENCLLLSGFALRQYFGAVLSDRLFVALSNIPVNVNVASAPALCSIPH